MSGYDYEFVPNRSLKPGTHHFTGLWNPSLLQEVKAYAPDAVLLMAYNYASLYHFIWRWKSHDAPLLFRGDSHRLVPRSGLKELARRKFIASIFKKFSAVLYVGKANRHYFEYHEVPAHKLFFAPHAVDNDRFFAQNEQARQQALVWRKTFNIPDDHAVILFAGKFETKKRPQDLLQAFIAAAPPTTILLFVGSGPLEIELKRAAAGHPRIRFAPFQNQSLMPRTYLAADVVVLPSYGPSETWGLAINEAMCMGCAVIVSTHVGCAQDLVYPGKNGLIFPAGDIASLATCLKEALEDRQRLRRWGQESQRIISGYSYFEATRGLKEALKSTGALMEPNAQETTETRGENTRRLSSMNPVA